MKDENITVKVVKLNNLVKDINEVMKELDQLNVEVRIGYVEPKKSDNTSQGIHVWRVIEHNDYLNNE
jgi:hypothetical protein